MTRTAWAYCECDCHVFPGAVTHCTPCCSGECNVCRRHVRGSMAGHTWSHHADAAESGSDTPTVVEGKNMNYLRQMGGA